MNNCGTTSTAGRTLYEADDLVQAMSGNENSTPEAMLPNQIKTLCSRVIEEIFRSKMK